MVQFVSHTTKESLCDYFGEEILPSNYGGRCKSLRELMRDWQEVLNDNADWFLEQESVKITSIPEKIKRVFYFKDQLGVDGSFRQLSID
ncbi:hypothetical protein NQ314_004955 [Rhamnusium bicolor]|uniref:Uncharacterized protein n=1 Tax=Rhamnusium bicolor TaxID=1586634 RepID=A0AAV8ZKH9_9CUCU|nr:hypothetical protein NQ314_004955 [Rhamnusium bicolor]